MWMGSLIRGTNADQEKSNPIFQVWNGRAQWYTHCGKIKIMELVGIYLVDF